MRISRIIVPVAFFATTLLIITLIFNYQVRTFRVPVMGSMPRNFPVLVVTQGRQAGSYEARVVFKMALDDYLRSHRNYSFKVPKGQERILNQKLAKLGAPSEEIIRKYGGSIPYSPWGQFEVKHLPDGRQRLKVDGTWDTDYDNIGWYVADARSITPEAYQTFFGPGVVMMSLYLGISINAVIWGAVHVIYRRRRAHQQMANLR